MMKHFILSTVFVVALVTSCNSTQKKETTEKQQSVEKEYVENEYKVFVLNDVTFQGDTDILISPDPDTLKKYLPDGFQMAVNAFLVQHNDSNFLFDTGVSGEKLVENLAAHGVKPENVHKIFISHCHFDHIGGLFKEGENVFSNAELYINRLEYGFWLKKQDKLFLQVVEKYKNQLQLFDIEEEEGKMYFNRHKVLSAYIQAVAAYGHTPGHTVYFVGSAENKTLIWGDLTHVMPILMPHPEYSVTYDVDSEQAAKTRQYVLFFVAKHNVPVASVHVPGGIGNIKNNEKSGYYFTTIGITSRR